ncbi:MAG: hypothetical protein CL868_12435 [Cytophagaceae bacterium]|nr:hypothetical protein [Cytophagaceae bacterium]|tara:strand:+ start:1780 stop:2457 length:678 start_codon:yes stop_codon:yes gene_type:complete
MTLCYSRFIWIFILFSTVCSAQVDLYLQPEISINYTPLNRWSFNFGVGNRTLVVQDGVDKWKAQHLEFTHFTSYESGFYSKISLGLKYRNRDWFDPARGDEYRITQQYSHARSYNSLRVSHRIRFEQRLYTHETVYRARYRIGIDTPLQGLALNTGEFYGSLTTEILYSISHNARPELDQRITTSLGNQIMDGLKLQLGLEYRFENHIHENSQRILLTTAAIYKI